MYYCPDAHGTILSPTAFVQQYSKFYHGYQKFWNNIGKQEGYITLITRDEYENVTIPLFGSNDLWYHTHSHGQVNYDSVIRGSGPTANRLPDAAKWELWHQRLAHPGTRVIEEEHKHPDGVLKLRGNAFYWCPSCMANKLCRKKTITRHTNLGSTQESNTIPYDSAADNSLPDPDDDEFELYLSSNYQMHFQGNTFILILVLFADLLSSCQQRKEMDQQ